MPSEFHENPEKQIDREWLGKENEKANSTVNSNSLWDFSG